MPTCCLNWSGCLALMVCPHTGHSSVGPRVAPRGPRGMLDRFRSPEAG